VRLFAFLLMFFLPFAGHANQLLLVPVFTPKPEYPDELIKTRYAGKVRVSLTIGSQGTVQAARVIESSHPRLAEAAQRALVHFPIEPLSNVDVFWYTREYLSSHYMRHLLPEDKDRQLLLVQLGEVHLESGQGV